MILRKMLKCKTCSGDTLHTVSLLAETTIITRYVGKKPTKKERVLYQRRCKACGRVEGHNTSLSKWRTMAYKGDH